MKSAAISFSLLLCVTGFAGCGSGVTVITTPPVTTPPAGSYSGVAFTAKVLAGNTPLAGATVQVYAAGTTGNGSAPTQLNSSTLTADATGSVSVAAGYTCPTSASIVYLVATGGHIGAGASNLRSDAHELARRMWLHDRELDLHRKRTDDRSQRHTPSPSS